MNHPKRQFDRLILIVVLLLFPLPVCAADLLLNDEAVFRYARHLYRNGEYYRAVTEYKRLIHFFPDSDYREEAGLQIGRSFMAGGRTDYAIRYWADGLDGKTTDEQSLNRIRMLYGISLLDLNRTRPFRLRSKYISTAMTTFADVKPVDSEGMLIRDFVHDWSSLPEPETKSPWVAGSMSAVIPGSGSFYTGRRIEGVYAFFLTSLFCLATMDAMRHEDATLTGVFGFFTLAFYGGNIYTAVNSAHKYNDQIQSDSLQRLREKHGIWFVPETRRRGGRF